MSDSPLLSLRRRTGLLVPGRRAAAQGDQPTVSALTARPGLHEVYAASVPDGPAALGFVLGALAQKLRDSPPHGDGPHLVWVRQDWLGLEAGRIHAPGLMEHGLSPGHLALVSVREVLGVLQAGLEAARCSDLRGVILEIEGASRLYDLTASRRLNRAALGSDVGIFLIRHGAQAVPSAAETRWRVAACASRPLAANAAGFPAFDVTLLRNRSGREGQEWTMEWKRDGNGLVERIARGPAAGEPSDGAALSGAVVPLPADRTAGDRRRAG